MSQSARVLFAGILLVLLGACSQAPGALDGGPLDDAAGRAEGPTADLALPGDAPMDGAANDLQGTPDAGDGAPSTDTIIDISTDIITDIETDSSSMDAEVAVADGSGTDAGGEDTGGAPVDAPGDSLGDAPGTSDAAPEVSGEGPTLRLLEPAAGATLTGLVTLRYALTAPAGVQSFAVLLDGVSGAPFDAIAPAYLLDTTRSPSGPHTVGLRVTDAAGRSADATVSVVFRNPTFRLARYALDAFAYRNGATVALEATYEGAGFDLSVAFSDLDSGWDPTRMRVEDLGGGRYTVRYVISTDNDRPDGVYYAVLTASDRASPGLVARQRVAVRLENVPRMPLTAVDGVFRDAPSAFPEPPTPGPDADAGAPAAPTVTALTGPGRIARGGSAAFEVTWTALPDLPVRAVRVGVEGLAGYLVVPVTDPTATRQTITLGLPLDSGDALPAGTHRLMVSVVDAGMNPSASRALAVIVEDLGRGGGLTTNLSGVVTYDRLDVIDTSLCSFNLTPATTPLALSGGALVRVVRSSDGRTLAQTRTGRDGRYALDLPATLSAVHLEALTERGTTVSVVTHAGVVHSARGPDFTARLGAQRVNLQVTGTVAGAFNIFRTLAEGRDEAEALLLRPIPDVQALWTFGEFGGCGGTASCYRRSVNKLFFNERDDPDQWDDAVHRHEFGHFLTYNLSVNDSPGGPHGTTRSDPRLAWSEGLATYLGAALANNPCYYDYRPSGAFGYNIFIAANLTGTSDGTETGEVSEDVVSGLLWHLDDDVNAFFTDAVAFTRESILWTVFSFLPTPGRMDRGFVGVDFVDFLYGYLCRERCLDGPVAALLADPAFAFPFRLPTSFAYCPPPYRAVMRGALCGPGGLAGSALASGYFLDRPAGPPSAGAPRDLAVGAPGAELGAGAVYVRGRDPMAPARTVRPRGSLVQYTFGSALAAGDLDGDGYDDLVIGTPGRPREPGIAEVVWGGRGFPNSRVLLGSGTEPGRALGDQFGFSVAVGDVNGDGWRDVVVGCPSGSSGTTGIQRGRAYLFLQQTVTGGGRSAGRFAFSSFNLYLEGSIVRNTTRWGHAVAVGRVRPPVPGFARNEPLVVGAPWAGAPGTNTGIVRWFPNFSGGLENTQLGMGQYLLPDARTLEQFGGGLALGDFDLDGATELFAGAANTFAPSGPAGRVLRFAPGGTTWLTTDPPVVVNGPAEASRAFGHALAAGDARRALEPAGTGARGYLFVGDPHGRASTAPDAGVEPPSGRVWVWRHDPMDRVGLGLTAPPLVGFAEPAPAAGAMEPRSIADRFGWSVLLADTDERFAGAEVLVGAPGYEQGLGAVWRCSRDRGGRPLCVRVFP